MDSLTYTTLRQMATDNGWSNDYLICLIARWMEENFSARKAIMQFLKEAIEEEESLSKELGFEAGEGIDLWGTDDETQS